MNEPIMNLNGPTLGDSDFDGIAPPQKSSGILKMSTDQNAPLVVKLVADPRRPKDAFFPVFYHRHMVGPSERMDGRTHLCPKTFQQTCPECDRYWELVGEMKKLKEAGRGYVKGPDGKDVPTPEFAVLKKERDIFKQQERFWLLVLPAGETRPKALLVTKDVNDQLFGRKADKGPDGKDRPAVTGLFYGMKDRGRSPFNLKNPTGWVKMYRTGDAPKVTFHVLEHMVEGSFINPADNMPVQAFTPFKNEVPAAVLQLTADDIIDVSTIDTNNDLMNWNQKELEIFVATKGVQIPERCRKKSDWNDSGNNESNSRSILSGDDEPQFAQAAQPAPQAQAVQQAQPAPQQVVQAQVQQTAQVQQSAPVVQGKVEVVSTDGLDGLF